MNREIKEAIKKYLDPMELLSKSIQEGDHWTALIAVTPSGPLLRMQFRV